MMFYLVLLVQMVFAERPGLGECAVNTCKSGLIEEQDYCCWRGQGWTGTACVGTPQCPDTFSKSGSTCKPVNGYGLCDMSGNVYEWVWDFYGEYPREPVTNPRGVSSASRRVFRGGFWNFTPNYLRSAERFIGPPSSRGYGIGFRLARSVQ